MKANSLTTSSKLIVQVFWDFLYFPLWWYSVGWARFGNFLRGFVLWQEASLGFSVWLKNLFRPMYGQRDFTGRLISFFIRLTQIIFRGFMLLVVTAIALVLFFCWALLPAGIVYGIIYQLI